MMAREACRALSVAGFMGCRRTIATSDASRTAIGKAMGVRRKPEVLLAALVPTARRLPEVQCAAELTTIGLSSIRMSAIPVVAILVAAAVSKPSGAGWMRLPVIAGSPCRRLRRLYGRQRAHEACRERWRRSVLRRGERRWQGVR
jgi:hypothetical protein